MSCECIVFAHTHREPHLAFYSSGKVCTVTKKIHIKSVMSLWTSSCKRDSQGLLEYLAMESLCICHICNKRKCFGLIISPVQYMGSSGCGKYI